MDIASVSLFIMWEGNYSGQVEALAAETVRT
jgi:hypothetical protein